MVHEPVGPVSSTKVSRSRQRQTPMLVLLAALAVNALIVALSNDPTARKGGALLLATVAVATLVILVRSIGPIGGTRTGRPSE